MLSISNIRLELDQQANHGTILHAPVSPPQSPSGPGRSGELEHPGAGELTHVNVISVINCQVMM